MHWRYMRLAEAWPVMEWNLELVCHYTQLHVINMTILLAYNINHPIQTSNITNSLKKKKKSELYL